MPGEATTEGSIVAYLRLNTSDWDAKLDAAEAKARELGRMDPDIRVTADVADAIAKLEAVKEIEAKVGGTTTTVSRVTTVSNTDSNAALQAAQQSVLTAAYKRADEAIQKLRDDQIVDDEAMRSASIQALKESLNMEALAAAERKAADAALQNAAAQDTAAAATDRGNQAAGVSIGRTGLIAAGIAALVPLTGAVAGATVALGGAFAGMGAAGLLAFEGIKTEMTAGTAAGIQYTAGIKQLRDNLDILSATAAIGMLGSFEQAVATIDASMPSLNSQVGIFTGYAGRIGNDALAGAVNALRVLNPLFVQAGDYVEHLAQGFLQWTQNGGLAKFTAYATGEFPQVVATIDSLVQSVMHVVEAFAPWGGTMLTAIKAVGDTINAIPTWLLPELAIGATAAYLAFSKWSTLKAGISGVGDSLQQVSSNAKGAFATILQVTAAVDVMVLQMTAAASDGIKQWQGLTQSQDKWAASVRAGHIDTQALGTTLQRVGGFWNDFGNNMDLAGTAFRPFYNNVKALDQALATSTPADLKRGYAELVSEGAKVGKSQKEIAALFPEATAAIHAQEQGSNAAAGATGRNASMINQLADAQKAAKTATDQFVQALAGLGSVNLAETQANVAFQQSIADATTALKTNGATLDQNTQKGRDNTTALDGIASSAVALIAAHAKAGVSTQDLTADMTTARASFIKTAEQMGANSDEANRLADQYGLVPKDVPTAFKTSGAAQAQADAAAVQAAMNAISRLVVITVQTNQVGAPVNTAAPVSAGKRAYATGGPVYRAGGGSIMDQVSYLAGGGGDWRPQGTDTVRAMLTPGEFVVKEPSASFNPGFMKAYNDNPAGALAAVRGSGQTVVSLKGATIVMNVDGRQITAVIQDQILQANRHQAGSIIAGRQKGA